MIKFNVIINPFLKRVLISARINKISCEEVVDFNFDIDAWKVFDMGGKRFVVHITYEDESFVKIYDDNDYDIQSPYPTTFKLTYKDEF